MLYIIEKEIEFDETLKMRIELICKLAHVKPVFHNGSMKKIETIQENNKALNIKVKALEKQNKEQKKKIIELDKLADHFKKSSDKFMTLYYGIRDKFDKFIKFIAERLLNPKTKEKYKDFVGDLFGHGILTYNASNEINKTQETILEEKENKITQPKKSEKEKDDFEL